MTSHKLERGRVSLDDVYRLVNDVIQLVHRLSSCVEDNFRNVHRELLDRALDWYFSEKPRYLVFVTPYPDTTTVCVFERSGSLTDRYGTVWDLFNLGQIWFDGYALLIFPDVEKLRKRGAIRRVYSSNSSIDKMVIARGSRLPESYIARFPYSWISGSLVQTMLLHEIDRDYEKILPELMDILKKLVITYGHRYRSSTSEYVRGYALYLDEVNTWHAYELLKKLRNYLTELYNIYEKYRNVTTTLL